MLERRLWSDEEMDRLRVLYVSGRGFDEIDTAFPKRSANAIRQKASRLGVKRPVVSNSLCESMSVLRCSDSNGDDAFLSALSVRPSAGTWPEGSTKVLLEFPYSSVHAGQIA